jgi:threonine dehydratase
MNVAPFPNYESILKAREVISQYLQPTPLLHNPWLSEVFGCEIYLKLENMQPIGSFKIRGAINRCSQLTPEQKTKGVVAASAGNHAQGVAWAARRLGVQATIVMPATAPLVKIQNTESLGAKVILKGHLNDAFEEAQRIAQETGKVFIHAFDDPAVIAGQGTAGLEIIEQLPDVEVVISAIGGGGWISGLGLALKTLKPNIKLIGAQAKGASAMAESIQSQIPKDGPSAKTFADGIAVTAVKQMPYEMIRRTVDQILTADDEEIASAILTLAEKAKIVTEGAAAVSLAILKQLRERVKGKKVCLVIGGGNIDVNLLNRVIDRGLTRMGRRLRVNVIMSDRPGSLATLTAKIAECGANIIQAIHDRSEPSVTIDRTEVQLTLETRGHEHSQQVIDQIQKVVEKIEVL